MKTFTLKFKVPTQAKAIKCGEKTAVETDFSSGILTLSIFYSFRSEPLKLCSKAAAGDLAEVSFFPFHIVLYINGELCDEEWPCGENYVYNGSCDTLDFEISDGAKEFTLPCRKGISEEELRLPGVNIGDCMPFSDENCSDGRFHLYWLYDRHHHQSKWGLGTHQWAHASTYDLNTWNEHPMAVNISDEYEGSVCTGSTMYHNGRYYAWYAVRMADGSPARVSYSYSDDGEIYKKSGEYFILPERYHLPSVRDPKVIFHDGKFHMIITTSLVENGKGCLAHLVSENADMSDFSDLGPIIVWENGEQPECPDYFEACGRYYLVWSIGGRARYAFSENAFGEGGWSIPENNILDCGSVPKSALLPSSGERIFVGFIGEGGYAGHLIIKKADFLDNGFIVLSEVK